MINLSLSDSLCQQLKQQLWWDDLVRMPRDLYPELSDQQLYQIWQPNYDRLFMVSNRQPSSRMQKLFQPAHPRDLQGRYLADPDGAWYAVITPRYNRRTSYRFCYVRYWWAAACQSLAEMVKAIMAAWSHLSFDWIKVRLGYDSAFVPTDFHPRATLQNYAVVGRLNPSDLPPDPEPHLPVGLTVSQPGRLTDDWWSQFRILVDEQERLAPGLEDWNDYETSIRALRQELARALRHGGGAVNLWQADRLVGHISWRPESYGEQLLSRCWHINYIIVKASQRRQGLGTALHQLALRRMNLAATPFVGGLIRAANEISLKTAARLGRRIVDSYLIVPKY